MRINVRGQGTDEQTVRIAHIGCGSHSFRNLFPAYQFVPIDLVATCDLDEAKAKAFAEKFSAKAQAR